MKSKNSIYALILGLYSLSACSGKKTYGSLDHNKQDSLLTTIQEHGESLSAESNLTPYDSISKNPGFVGLQELSKSVFSFEFFNLDNSPFQKNNLLTLKNNKSFEPYAYNPDYFLLYFRCIKKDKNYYTVIINEKTSETKLLKVDEKNIRYLSWEQLILNSFSVNFSPKENPLREKPSTKSAIIEYQNHDFYLPVEINGDWLKVKWGSENNWTYGYILWKQHSKLLIELNFFA